MQNTVQDITAKFPKQELSPGSRKRKSVCFHSRDQGLKIKFWEHYVTPLQGPVQGVAQYRNTVDVACSPENF